MTSDFFDHVHIAYQDAKREGFEATAEALLEIMGNEERERNATQSTSTEGLSATQPQSKARQAS